MVSLQLDLLMIALDIKCFIFSAWLVRVQTGKSLLSLNFDNKCCQKFMVYVWNRLPVVSLLFCISSAKNSCVLNSS